MWLNPHGEDPVRLAVALANDPPQSPEELMWLLEDNDLETPQPVTPDDLPEILQFIDHWLTVIDANDDASRAERLNEILAQHSSHPRLTNHRLDGWHLHFREDDCSTSRLVSVLISVGTAMFLANRGMHRIGRCAASGCQRVWADFSRPGTQRYCSPRCANTDAVRRHRGKQR